ncbi:MAG: hypothetical protein H7A25_19525 [Leptospiraceae bacterium]|nr:hypothetical protein [Leptospiraceae bacterium]MCP5502097.1 hypothetical protein [Leptospiraceae bacterium]
MLHLPSATPIQKDIMDFRFNHRFGNAKSTSYDLLGLDQGANIQLSLDYGITDKLSVGFARSSAYKTYEGRSKFTLFEQGSFPLTLAIAGSVGFDTQKKTIDYGPYVIPQATGVTALDTVLKRDLNRYKLSVKDRTGYFGSILMDRKFGEMFSLQVAPLFVHRNFVKPHIANDRWGLDLAGRIHIAGEWAIMFETIVMDKRDYIGEDYNTVDSEVYGIDTTKQLTAQEINDGYHLSKASDLNYVYFRNVLSNKKVPHYSVPFSVGLSYETGGHMYQVFVTNMRALAYTHLLHGADYNYNNREWTIGFNINRYYSFAKDEAKKEFEDF